MFKRKFTKLCNERNEAPSAVCIKLGLSNATYSQWNENSIPRESTLIKIAEYFNVTVEYLKSEESEGEKALVFNESFTESEKKIILAYRSHPEMHEAVHKILGIRQDRITMREIFEINFWSCFCYWCNEKNIAKEDVSKTINVPLDKLEKLFQAENTKEYPLLNRISKCLDIAPDELLGIHPAMVVETDLLNARTILLKKDISNFDSRVTEVFENSSTFSAGLSGYLDYWKGNLSGLAYIAGCDINELVGRPRPLSSETPSPSATIAAKGNAELQIRKGTPKTSDNL